MFGNNDQVLAQAGNSCAAVAAQSEQVKQDGPSELMAFDTRARI